MDLSAQKNFELFFKAISYGVVISGLFSLTASGGMGLLVTTLFLLVLILSWFLENTRWQLSEKTGVILIFLIVPLFYLDWKYRISGLNTREAIAAGNLARLILILSSVKLLQKKGNRDWAFLYLISFFEVLLAAGLSISPLFLISLAVYLLFAVCSIVGFEIKKTSNNIFEKNNQIRTFKSSKIPGFQKNNIFRLSVTSIGLLFSIALFALPLFFVLPRVGGSGLGKNFGGLSGFTGFSDSVRLGEIGKLKQNEEVVMRVKLEEGDRSKINNFRWRGVALDTFDNLSWRKSIFQQSEPFIKSEKDFFIIDSATHIDQVVTQTIYLEPIDTPVLFALSRPVALQGNFKIITKDSEGSLTYPHIDSERLTYKVYSDTFIPDVKRLRADNFQYSSQARHYLKLPDTLDQRIFNLGQEIIQNSGASNRYDQAKAVENYLQTNYGYTLELKAGGAEPLADFLFNVREGHCEYFATAMAILLRTQGIATRIVNGFQQGEYNETADVYIVKQKDAHSWVEVYFPKENVWIPFDPTPSAGQFSEQTNSANLIGRFDKFVQAMETFWIQYVVSYDNQEQKSLFRSVKANISDYHSNLSNRIKSFNSELSDWWKEVRGDNGFESSAKVIGFSLAYLIGTILGVIFLIRFYRTILKLSIWKNIFDWFKRKNEANIIEFYERMQRVLAGKGLVRAEHQTPLEFAFELNMPEAVSITEKYNSVRFGEKDLSTNEAKEIENWLKDLEAAKLQENNAKKH
ncbi:MAG: transglutaminaseTgpA domain-containing protein [Pyrinomonadaceae bacterium]